MEKKRVYIGGHKEFSRKLNKQSKIFIAHDFSGDNTNSVERDTTRQIADYRLIYQDGLTPANFVPAYAPTTSGTILDTLVEEMVNCVGGIFDLSYGRQYNANVLIELGISLGLNLPTVVIATTDQPLLSFLTSLNPYYYSDNDKLAESIGDVVRERVDNFNVSRKYFCEICQQNSCVCRIILNPNEKTYSLLGADKNLSLKRDMRAMVKEFGLSPVGELEQLHNSQLCENLYNLKRSQFVLLYSQEHGNRHHGEGNALTMVQLGLCIGANVKWRFIIDEREDPPTDIRNLIDIRLNESAEINRAGLAQAIGSMLNESDPSKGHFAVLEAPWDNQEEKHDIVDDNQVVSIETQTTIVSPKDRNFRSGSYGKKTILEYQEQDGRSILYVPTAQRTSEVWVEWNAELPTSGRYEVSVFVPENHATTSKARYKIHGIKGTTTEVIVAVDQFNNHKQWVSLGIVEFDKDQPKAGKVFMNDVTGEIGKEIAFDMVRFRHIED